MTEIDLLVRRYWFANSMALDALSEAVAPPDWGQSQVPVTIFYADDETAELLAPIADEDDKVTLADIHAFEVVLGRERARYVQFAFRAVADFEPGLELIFERLEKGDLSMLTTDVLSTGKTRTVFAEPAVEGGLAEACWLATRLLQSCTDCDPRTVFESAVSAAEMKTHLNLVGGTYFGGHEGDAASYWRAQSALAWNEIERLKTERRIRQGREAALSARHDRDLARLSARYRGEIGRLHRAAGWAGKWRARLSRLLPGSRLS